jgi:hypothetical protein
MISRTLTLRYLLCCGLVLLAPASGFAQAAPPPSFPSDSQRLRADLDRVNAEIAGLKSGGRSVRNDYLLRDKLAEAEALARKLTEAEKGERASRTTVPKEIPGSALVPPVATPHDSAVELEAKADLLSDQARRFRAEADTLASAAEKIRARQALRRRAGAWDRDPLAGFEGSKRNFAVSGRATTAASDSSGSRGTSQGSSGAASNGATKGATGDTAFGGSGTTPTSTPVPLGPGSATAGPAESSPVIAISPSTSHPVSAPTVSVSDSASKALQQRPLLDPASLASVRSTLSQSGSLSDPDSIEAAVITLRKHAQALEERSRRLRAGVAQE